MCIQYALKCHKPRICKNARLSLIFTAEVLAQFLLQLKKITESISFDQITRQLGLLFFDFQFSLHPSPHLQDQGAKCNKKKSFRMSPNLEEGNSLTDAE